MGEFDELVSREGVLMAGRFAADWSVAESKTTWLFSESPAAIEMMGWFCAAIQMMLGSMGVAMGGFSPVSWRPVHGWAVSLGEFSFALHGDRFVVAETAKIGSFDELRTLLHAEKS